MSPQELNRDIKRLHKLIELNAGNEFFENIAKPEFKRLYHADKEFKYMNKESIKIMLRLNLKYRFESLHMFGIYINY